MDIHNKMRKLTVSDIMAIKSSKQSKQIISSSSVKYTKFFDNYVVIYFAEGILCLYAPSENIQNGLLFQMKIELDDVVNMTFNGALLAIVTQSCNFIVINIQSGIINPCKGHVAPILDVCSFENYFVTASKDYTIRIWEKNDNLKNQKKEILLKHPIALKGHKGPVTSLAVYDKFLISGSEDGAIICWLNKAIWSIYQFAQPVGKITVCPLSSQIMVLTKDQVLHFIQIDSIISKKIQIRGSINCLSNSQQPVFLTQIDQSFAILLSGNMMRFLQVNLIKQIHSLQIMQKNENNRITDIKANGKCVLYGLTGNGPRIIKFLL